MYFNPSRFTYGGFGGLFFLPTLYNVLEFRKDMIKEFFNIINKYPFYKTIFSGKKNPIINQIKQLNDDTWWYGSSKKEKPKLTTLKYINEVIPRAQSLIEFIERNNSSTLIGTYENTDLLQTIDYTDSGCSIINNNGNVINNNINKIKYELYQETNKELKNILEKETFDNLDELIKYNDEKTKMLKEVLNINHDNVKGLIDDTFDTKHLKLEVKGGKKQRKNIKNNTKKVLRNRKNRTLRNK